MTNQEVLNQNIASSFVCDGCLSESPCPYGCEATEIITFRLDVDALSNRWGGETEVLSGYNSNTWTFPNGLIVTGCNFLSFSLQS